MEIRGSQLTVIQSDENLPQQSPLERADIRVRVFREAIGYALAVQRRGEFAHPLEAEWGFAKGQTERLVYEIAGGKMDYSQPVGVRVGDSLDCKVRLDVVHGMVFANNQGKLQGAIDKRLNELNSSVTRTYAPNLDVPNLDRIDVELM